MTPVSPFIFRGPAPTTAIDGSIKATLDLESGAQVLGDDLPLREALLCESVGVRCYPHPLGGLLPPSVEELRLAAQFLSRQQSRQEATLVHCKHGVDRTGMVIAAHRILNEKWTPRTAARECLGMGMHWIYLFWLVQLWRV